MIHSLGLKSDGTIVAWGDNSYGQCNVPSPNADFVAVAAGVIHSLGLKSDSTIVAWGEQRQPASATSLAPNADFVAASAGGVDHSLGLKSDGTIVAWGLTRTTASACPLAEHRLRGGRGGLQFTAWASRLTGRSWPGEDQARPVRRPPAERRLRGDRGGCRFTAWA